MDTLVGVYGVGLGLLSAALAATVVFGESPWDRWIGGRWLLSEALIPWLAGASIALLSGGVGLLMEWRRSPLCLIVGGAALLAATAGAVWQISLMAIPVLIYAMLRSGPPLRST